MPHYEFIWTAENLGHLAEHGVTPDEAEQVVCHPITTGVSRSSKLPLARGYTLNRRQLVVIYDMIDEMTVYPVTAYDVE